MLPIHLIRVLALLKGSDKRQGLVWLYSAVLATAPGVALVQIYSRVEQAVIGPALSLSRVSDPASTEGQLLLSSVCFFSFFLLFCRLAAGDYRYMWQRYRRIKDGGGGRVLSEAHYCFDLMFLTGQASLLVATANDVIWPERFFPFFEAVLMMNVCWLLYNYFRERNVALVPQKTGVVVTIQYLECHRAGARWAVNNLLALGAFFLLHHLQDEHLLTSGELLWASAAICLLNSVADLAATYWHYFPESSSSPLHA